MPLRGAPLRPSTVSISSVCVDGLQMGDFSGTIYNPYMPDSIPFQGVAALLQGFERIMDILDFPQAYESSRSFHPAGAGQTSDTRTRSVTRFMDGQVFETRVGRHATFIVQIQFRQNATWQGTITWTEQKKVQHFRSTLEMIKLMDHALEQARQADEAFPSWG